MVTVYSKAGCGQCQFTKKVLEQQGITFEEKRVDLDSLAMDYLKSIGIQSLPYVEVDNGATDSWTGFRPDRIKQLNAF